MRDKTKLWMSEGTAGSKLPPRRSKRMASPQTMGSGKKKKLAESSTKATVVSETRPEYSTSRCNSHFMTRKKCINFERIQLYSILAKVVTLLLKHSSLTKWQPILTVSRMGISSCFISTEATESLYQ